MRYVFWVVLLFTSVFLGATGGSLNSDLILSDWDVATYEEESVAGSGIAPRKLGSHFLETGKMDTAIYWLSIGAENGDVVCMNNLAFALKFKADRLSKMRALYWFNKIAQSNDPDLTKNATAEAKSLEAWLKVR